MIFQQQVRTSLRTKAEIDAERQGEIVVHPQASKTADECFPCIAIEVIRPGQRALKTWVDLRKLGRHFDTMDDALAAAKTVQVISVDENGEVVWQVKPE